MYTSVRVDSVKSELETSGLQIIIVARGVGLADVPDIIRMNGVPFDPIVLRHAARALLDRLNANLAARTTAQALVGTDVDVTSPLPPLAPVTDPSGMC